MIDDAELASLEREVQDALHAVDQAGLSLLGEGELTLVLAAGEGPRWACKRLPPFESAAAADRYAAVVDRYVAELGGRGVEVVDTTVRCTDAAGGRTALYCVQPILPSPTLAVEVARRDPDAGRRMVDEIVDIVLTAVDPRIGIDAQLSNWALVDGRLVYFDVTTPLLNDDQGRPILDTGVFVASLPWVLRSLVGRVVAPGILRRYHDPRTVVVDFTANLIKEGLDELVPCALAASAGRVTPAPTDREIRRDRRNDVYVWGTLQAVRRVDRAWQRHVRRRDYPFLLPTHRHR